MSSISKETSPNSFDSTLPRLFALKNIANKYMRCESEGDAGRVLFSVKAILYEPRTMFEAEPTSIPGVVHIRCTFNNKYLRRDSITSDYVNALGTQKSEQRNQWDCTMFEVIPAKQGGGQIWLRHVQLGYYLRSYVEGLGAFDIMPSDSVKHLNFTFINWSTLVILPRYVAFKGPNGKYLNAKQIGTSNNSQLQFCSDDKGEEGVTMEVIPASDGNVRISQGPGQGNTHWNVKFGNFSDDFSLVFAPSYSSAILQAVLDELYRVNSPLGFSPSTFQAVKDETNRVSFKCLYNNKFCRIKNLKDWPDSYVADSSSITQDTKLIIEEAVMRRTLEIEWRLQDARVYNVVPYELNGSTHDNNSSSPVTKLVTLSYETAVTTSFETSHTWAAGIKTTIATPSIPFIGGGMKIEMSAQYGGSYTWGETTTNTRRFSETDNYTIPPRTRLVVQKLSTKGYCDVPYKYVQTDYLLNGDVIRTNKEDGVFKGINYFNIHTSNRDEPLPGSLWRAVPTIFVGRPISFLVKFKEPFIFLLLACLFIVMMEKFPRNSSS